MLDLSAEAPANETKFDLRVLSRIGCIRNWVEAVNTAIAPSAMQRRGARLLSAKPILLPFDEPLICDAKPLNSD